MKKTMHLFLAVLLLISICFANPIYASHANVEQLEKTDDLAEYILQNLEAFSKEYNNMILDTVSTYGISKNDLSLFQADFCENRFTIPCLYGEKSVECLDFDGANGYMIIDGQKVLKIVTQGNPDELYRYPGKVYFSEPDNEFAYFDDENGYCTFGHRETEDIALESSYAGTDNGVIKNDLVYLNDKYPDFQELWNNDVIIWADSNDIYGSHTTVVTSACVYKKYSVILGVEVCMGTINMLSLWDGHSDQIVYYEFESSGGNGIIFNF